MAKLDQLELPNGVIYDLDDKFARKLTDNDFDTINVTELNAGDLIVTGGARFLNTINGDISGNSATATSATSATKATQDESGNNIKSTYANAISISDHTITLKNKNGTSLGTVTVPDNNTTYTVGTGTANGKIKVTPSSGNAYEVSVYGLKSAAYKDVVDTYSATGTDPVSGKAVAAALDSLPEPMVFKGSLGAGGTITALPVDGTAKVGDTYKVITAGTYASKAAKVGDTFICLTKTSSANTWELIPSGDEPSGTVTSVAISNGGGLSVSGSPITSSGTITVSHADTSSQASVNNSGRTYIQDITLDTYGHVTGITSATETVTNTDRYVNSAAFADATSADANNPVKMTLTRAGSDTASVTAYIPKVSSSSAGVAPKGAAVSSQSQTTKFLREDGTWAAPSYTTNTNTTYSLSASGESVVLSGSDSSSKSVSLSTLINGLSEGASPATSGDYIIAQYAGGGTTTKTYHRRKLSNIFKAMSSNDITTALGYTPPHEPVKDISNTPTPIATFSDAANLPMPSLKVAIEPQQDLHGYDAPWAGGAGKNKFDYSQLTNASGWTNTSGTYSGNIYNLFAYAGSGFPTQPTYKANTAYTLSMKVVDTDGTSRFIIEYTDSTSDYVIITSANVGNYVTVISNASKTISKIYFTYNNSGNLSIREIMLEEGTSRTSWTPYSNICPISGWTEEVITVSPLNISLLYNGQIYGNGDWGSSNQRVTNASNAQDNLYFLKAGTYTLDYDKLNSNAPNLLQCTALTKDDNYTPIDNFANSWNSLPFTFTLTQDGYLYFTVRKDAETFINPSDYRVKIVERTTTIPFTDGQGQSVEVFGGSVDVTEGKVNVTHYRNKVTSVTRSTSTTFYRNTTTAKGSQYGSRVKCDKFASASTSSDVGVFINSSGAVRFNTTTEYASASEFMEAYGGEINVVYERETPYDLILNPTSIKSLDGENNIFANCGQIIEGKYVVQDYSDITSKISEFAQVANTASKLGSSNVGSATQPIYLSGGTATACTYTLGKSVPSDAVFTDTKNTAGSTDTSSKIFLIGATSQAANPQTYSQDTAYVGTDGCLYSGGTKVLTAHQDISGKVSKTGDTMTGCLSITSANSSWAEGIRINRGNGGYCSFVMGGAANSTSGTGDNVWWLGCNPSSYSHKWFVAHNGSTQTGTYFYVDSSTQQSPHFRVGGDLAVGSKTTMSKTCTLRYNDSTLSLDFIFTT